MSDETILRWAIGSAASKRNILPDELRELIALFPELSTNIFSDSPPDLAKLLFMMGEAHMEPHHRKQLQNLIIADSSLSHVDARCVFLPNGSAIGVDTGLFLLLHNVILLIFSWKDLKIPGLENSGNGLAFKEVGEQIFDQVLSAVNKNIVCLNEALISDKDRVGMMANICTWSELFIIFHEVGHLIKYTDPKYTPSVHSDRRDSFVLGKGFSSSFAGLEGGTEEIKKMWIEEYEADKYAALILKKFLASLGMNQSGQTAGFLISLFIIIHTMDLCYRLYSHDEKLIKSFYRHPPIFSRLMNCGVPYEFYEPNAKYDAPEPYRALNDLYSFISNMFNVLLVMENKFPLDAEWTNLMEEINKNSAESEAE